MSDEIHEGEAEIGEVIALARSARTLRSVPRPPRGCPPGGWYSRQKRPLKNGAEAVYLMYIWRDPESDRNHARSLGRLN